MMPAGAMWGGRSACREQLGVDLTVQSPHSRLPYRFIVVAFCAALVAVPMPAHAFEIFGVKLFGSRTQAAEDDVIGDPQHYEVEFAIADDDVEKRLKGASTLWADRDEPA